MRRKGLFFYITLYTLIISFIFAMALAMGEGATVFRENEPLSMRKCVIIDPGHGGIDGGATSCTGVLESRINLEIATKTNHIMHLLGIHTIMTRDTDRSIHTKGDSIAEQKLSDLKERIRIANSQDNGILISIHQNHFVSSSYSGAQVFYSNNKKSRILANKIQATFKNTINQDSHRQTKLAKGIYLMDKALCPAVLIECGFLSNPMEECKLRENNYQMSIAMILASTCSEYLFVNETDVLDRTIIN